MPTPGWVDQSPVHATGTDKSDKAWQVAASQGQKIYQINQDNINLILPQLNHSSETIADIRNAVAAGKVVTTSQAKVNINGWSGSGYIIIDPATGAGAYMIGGGLDGGAITMPPAYAWLFGIAAILIIASLFLLGLGGLFLLLLGIIVLGCAFSNYTNNPKWVDRATTLSLFLLGGLGLFLESCSGLLGLNGSARREYLRGSAWNSMYMSMIQFGLCPYCKKKIVFSVKGIQRNEKGQRICPYCRNRLKISNWFKAYIFCASIFFVVWIEYLQSIMMYKTSLVFSLLWIGGFLAFWIFSYQRVKF